ncbi:MAG: hypothetical protein JW779_12470 [Candidatus Thorarchaeota archaeon]|nr:hypothetical protein [Candidatus Thorarchaeota archaeon]
MEISKKIVIGSICVLLIVSSYVPVAFLDVPSNDRVIELSLVYKHTHSTFDSTLGWRGEEEYIPVSINVSNNTLPEVLGSEDINGFPLWANTSTWEVGLLVTVGDHILNITGNQSIVHNLACWSGIEEGEEVFYSKDMGLFLMWMFYQEGGAFPGNYWIDSEEYFITSDNLDDLDATYIRIEGYLLAGILVELAIIIGLVALLRSGKK